MPKELYAFRDDLRNRKTFVCFNGPVSQDLMAELGDVMRRRMESDRAGRSKTMTAFSMLVEQAQNIIRYSAETVPAKASSGGGAEALRLGIIMLGREDDGGYFVLCGNKVRSEDVRPLREKLTRLRNMDRDELRKHYKEQRRRKPDRRSKGAGLGFIEMAKKADRPIAFDFRKIDDDFHFFSVKTVI